MQRIDFRSITAKENLGSAIYMCVRIQSNSKWKHAHLTTLEEQFKSSLLIIIIQNRVYCKTTKLMLVGLYTLHLGSHAVLFRGLHNFFSNTAIADGGAIHAILPSLDQTTLVITKNSAQCGGAVHFSREATLTIAGQVLINTSHNHATELGGALYHEDNTVPIQCNFTTSQNQGIDLLPNCFLPHQLLHHLPGLDQGEGGGYGPPFDFDNDKCMA